MSKGNMFYGADVVLFERAKQMRNNMTYSERRLWERLSNNKLNVRFKPQHPLFLFIVDFYCHKAKLVIEVDGDVHFNDEKQTKDTERSQQIEALGIMIMRFTNEEIFKDLNSVVGKIRSALDRRLSQSPL